MFARGVVSLHTAHLPAPKTLTSKSRVSITSKLIQNTGLQALYSGHLRKTGGRGSYQLSILHPLFPPHSPLVYPEPSRRVYPESSRRACPPQHQRRRATSSISCISPTYGIKPRISFVSPTYAKTGECTPRKNVGAPTFLIFPLIFRAFLALSAVRRVARLCRRHPASRQRKRSWHESQRYIEEGGDLRRHRSLAHFLPPVSFNTAVPRAYCAEPWQNGT
jgi:hypothetical protein